MPLSAGVRLGSYEIVSPLGAGGMGEVYRATDTDLRRDVALKVLPVAVASDADRLARFQREAQVLAALNHPNIAQIYGVERSGGTTALVMELVEGPTLADRIAHGAIPIDEALSIARQIAEALEAAHERGIVHRDLKPANVKVRDDGTVKVLDFGLAKAMDPSYGPGAPADLSQSPTLTSPAMTQMGMILGTAAYMAPEQARGRGADARADVWAFGAVLFEMLSGQRAFDGDDVTDILGAVVRLEPKWDALPADVPPRIRQVIRGCLQKDLKLRIAHIHDVRLALDGAFETATQPAEASAPATPRWRRPAAAAAVAAAMALLVSAAAAWSFWPRQRPAEVSRFVQVLPAKLQFRNTGRRVLAVSPDGRAFVYNTASGLYLRRLSQPEAHLIPGTEDTLTSPFFSPDGDQVAYFHDGHLVRIATGGGTPIEIASGLTNILGGSWTPGGAILFGQPAGIMRVPSGGGAPELVIKAVKGEALASPQLLPDGDSILFALFPLNGASKIFVESLSTHKRTRILEDAADARYVPSGHLVYLVGDSLLAAPFDAGRLKVGEAAPVLQSVSHTVGGGFAQYAVADNGTLVFTSVIAGGPAFTISQLVWFSRTGDRVGTIGQPATILNFDLAPDGRVVTERLQGVARALWMADPDREWPLVPADFRKDGFISDPAFSPTGDRVAFSSGGADTLAKVGHQVDRIYVVPSDGGMPQPFLGQGNRAIGWLEDWSPDGQHLALLRNSTGVVSTVGRDADADDVVVEKNALVDELQFSPDGKWIAYHADRAAGGLNVYVVPYLPTGQVYKVSADNGGSQPKWRPDGRELFYLTPDGTLMHVPIETAPAFRAGRPEALFKTGLTVAPGRDQYAVAANGQRFLVAVPVNKSDDTPAPATIDIVLNWFEEVKRLAPAK